MSHSNHLANETSPYLLQHAENPVDWYPWGPEALQKARDENKPILLSIGYSACHWCHVMAHESFEDPQVARVMNDLYVNIKVDREERPDLDKIHQTAFQLLVCITAPQHNVLRWLSDHRSSRHRPRLFPGPANFANTGFPKPWRCNCRDYTTV